MFVLAACSSSRSSTVPVPPPTTPGPTVPARPSPAARLLYGREAAENVALNVGMKTIRPVQTSWRNGLYSCRFVYRGGASATVSVRELSTIADATAYTSALAKRLGRRVPTQPIPDIDDAFVTAKGACVVRDDSKIVVVDTKGLRTDFAHGTDDAQMIAAVVLSEWHPM